MQIEIRLWKREDIPLIAQTERETFSSPWNENMLLEEYANPRFSCLVAECGGEFAGYVDYHKIAGEFHIANLAVRANFRKKGAAKALLNSLFNQAKAENAIGITLEVRESNSAAISLYQCLGFKTEGIRKKFYGTEDGLIMWKYL